MASRKKMCQWIIVKKSAERRCGLHSLCPRCAECQWIIVKNPAERIYFGILQIKLPRCQWIIVKKSAARVAARRGRLPRVGVSMDHRQFIP